MKNNTNSYLSTFDRSDSDYNGTNKSLDNIGDINHMTVMLKDQVEDLNARVTILESNLKMQDTF